MSRQSELSDHELSILIRDRNMVAFDVIFEKFYRPLCFFATRIIQDNFDAQDIVQDTFVKFWQKDSTAYAITSIRAYLYVSVKNSCFNYLEKNNVKLKHQQYLVSANQPDDVTTLHTMIQAEVLRQVFAAVDTLPEQCRKIILMTFEDGKKARDIADELGITVSTVNNQKMRGLNLLRNRLSDEPFALGMLLILPGIINHIG
jgi:RNA polymerase sigma-70 factor (ECF subfamily)